MKKQLFCKLAIMLIFIKFRHKDNQMPGPMSRSQCFFFNFDVHGSLSISKTQCVYTYYKESNLQWQENIAVELLLNANRVKAMQMA